MAEQNDTMLAAVMKLLELKSSNKILDISIEFYTGCNDSIDTFCLKAVESLDDEKILECLKKIETYKKIIKPLLPSLSPERFNTFCARLAVANSLK